MSDRDKPPPKMPPPKMPPPKMPPPKMDVARALLLRGSVFVHLDPRIDHVVVPPWLRDKPQLVLQIGLDLPVPIGDLRVDDSGVSGTLSFNRAPFRCTVPWSAVFAMFGDDGMGMVWQSELPPAIAAEIEAKSQAERKTASPRRTKRPRLYAIEGGARAPEEETGEPPPLEPSPERAPRANHLRLVD